MFVDPVRVGGAAFLAPAVPLAPELDPDIPGLAPLERHRRRVELVNQAFARAGIDRNDPAYRRRGELIPERIFEVAEGDVSPALVGAAVSAGVGAFTEVTRQFVSPSTVERLIAMPRSAPETVSLFERLKNGSGKLAVIGLTGALACLSVRSYQQLSTAVRMNEAGGDRIQAVFHMIADDQSNVDELEAAITAVMQIKNGSWFSVIFDYNNPIELSYLLLTQGIMLDSRGYHQGAGGERDYYGEAQALYQNALSRPINGDGQLRDRLLYAYARSLRLSHAPEDAILDLINQITPNTPIATLGESEREAVNNPGIMDPERQIPAIYMCPLTLQLIVIPAVDQHGNYFERDAIFEWVQRMGRHPWLEEPLAVDNLRTEGADIDEFMACVHSVNRIALKPRP